MSVTESKTKTVKKASRKKKEADVVSQALISALDNAEVRYAAWSTLFIGELNCRIIPHTPEEIQEIADSLCAVGQLHNLVVVECEDGRLEVVCGGGRTRAFGRLVAAGTIDPDKPLIACKAIPRELARVASMTENGKRKNMHPSEQIIGFRSLAEEGKNPAQIGDLLGYGAKHVQRMLKLAGLPQIVLDDLARDRITTEHCQVLALENSPERQAQVYEAACQQGNDGKPSVHQIRSLVTESEVSTDCEKFRFVGETAFRPGDIRIDLFSDERGGYVDKLVLDTLVLERLEEIAEGLREAEGWAWCAGRMETVRRYGEDELTYQIPCQPDAVYTPEEEQRIGDIHVLAEGYDEACSEMDALEAELELIDCVAHVRGWTPEQKATSGVVVSWWNNQVHIQRGVMLREQKSSDEGSNTDDSEQTEQPETPSLKYPEKAPDPVEEISLPLLNRMIAERTLAVQAALMQQPDKSLAILAWTLCLNVFSSGAYSHPTQISLKCQHYSLTNTAPTGKTGTAYVALMEEKARLAALLPQGWERDVSGFFTLEQCDLLALLSFCTACSLSGEQTRVSGHTGSSPLNATETAIGFHLRDWWQPTKAGFFDGLKHAQIVRALTDAGLTGAASNAAKMKKGDAAEYAEEVMAATRWVPDWMRAPESKTEIAASGEPSSESDDHAESDNPLAQVA